MPQDDYQEGKGQPKEWKKIFCKSSIQMGQQAQGKRIDVNCH